MSCFRTLGWDTSQLALGVHCGFAVRMTSPAHWSNEPPKLGADLWSATSASTSIREANPKDAPKRD